MRKVLSALFILGGIVIIIYPTVQNIISERKQKEIVQRWDNVMDNLDTKGKINNDNIEINNEVNNETINNQDKGMNDSSEDRMSVKKETTENIEPKIIIKDGEEGILIIDKIEFKQPILKGASQENLSITVASVENTGEPGSGNYSIAGHRSKAYGKNFNRLDELENEDEIEIYTYNNKYTYLVYDKYRVNPDEVWVLEQKEGEQELTLITCDPIVNPNKRLIIKAKLKE